MLGGEGTKSDVRAERWSADAVGLPIPLRTPGGLRFPFQIPLLYLWRGGCEQTARVQAKEGTDWGSERRDEKG